MLIGYYLCIVTWQCLIGWMLIHNWMSVNRWQASLDLNAEVKGASFVLFFCEFNNKLSLLISCGVCCVDKVDLCCNKMLKINCGPVIVTCIDASSHLPRKCGPVIVTCIDASSHLPRKCGPVIVTCIDAMSSTETVLLFWNSMMFASSLVFYN